MASLNICFGDEVKLKDSRTGRVRYIGPTSIKKDAIFYGIHLKDKNGEHDGKDIDNRQCFKCPPKYGIFVTKSKIIKIIKKHTISASFYYDECVQMVNSNKRRGRIKYIGLTHFGSNYWYGIELESKRNNFGKSYLDKNEQNIYFNADRNKSIFVRANQIKSIANIQKLNKTMYTIEDDESVIDESMLSMMNTLNIPINARSDMLKMEKSKKILLIKQWFLTNPNSANRHQRRASAPTSPTPAAPKKKKKKNVKSFDDTSPKGKNRKKKVKKEKKVRMKEQGKTVLALSQTSDLGAFAESDSEDMPFDGCVVIERKTELRMNRSKSLNDNDSKKTKEKKKKKKQRTKSRPNIIKSEKKNVKRLKMEKSKSYNHMKTKKKSAKNKKKKLDETSLKVKKPKIKVKEAEEIDLKIESKENRTPKLKKYSKSLSLLLKRTMTHSNVQYDEEYYF